MVRSQLIDQLSRLHPDLKRSEIDALLFAFFEAISAQLVANGRVELRGFGSFTTRARGARTASDPRTGAAIDLADRRAVYFRPSKELNASLAPSSSE